MQRFDTSCRLPIGVATMKSRPSFVAFSILFVVILSMLVLSGCQFIWDSSTDPNPVSPETQRPAARSNPLQELSFVQLLDTVHVQLQETERGQIQRTILDWQRGLSDDHNRLLSPNFVRGASGIVLEFLDSPSTAIEQASRLTTVNEHEVNSLAILQAYLCTWNHDCENAIKFLATVPAQISQESEDRARRLWQIIRGTCAYRQLDVHDLGERSNEDHWWSLATMLSNSHTPSELHKSYREWRENYPDHLAAKFAPTIVAGTQPRIDQIALLLPQTGPLASAAQTIRDGFLSAHLHSNYAGDINIEVYDSSLQEITSLIERIIAEGADLIVGPLDKERVATVLAEPTYEVPVLALNRTILDNLSHPDIMQLGLAVEDDAVEVVRYLHSIDLRRVVLIMGAEYWSIRSGLAFKESAKNSLDLLDEIQLANMSQVADVVADVLHVTQSTARHEKISRIVGRDSLEFVTRRREDIDAIVTFVERDEFASLAATLHYYCGGDIPILATETSFRGLERTSTYSEGALFTAMPVTLHEFSFFEQLKATYPDVEQHLALYAFGADAYRASMWSYDLRRGHQITGYTGILQQDSRGVIHRQPIWGIIKDRKISSLHNLSRLTNRPKSLL
ncbi:MAG: penicillin-binding protein activator [Gammaproteobacteria bacterium]|nr:penicillin-binding protein activator [Gammaproteobacteria bacterium]